jgi:hypothetical protein
MTYCYTAAVTSSVVCWSWLLSWLLVSQSVSTHMAFQICIRSVEWLVGECTLLTHRAAVVCGGTIVNHQTLLPRLPQLVQSSSTTVDDRLSD